MLLCIEPPGSVFCALSLTLLWSSSPITYPHNIVPHRYELDDNEEGNRAAADALAFPEKYVLKPQREGGGNNLYEAEMQAALKQMSLAKRSGYILMERLYPPAYSNVVFRDSKMMEGDVVSELGVFGYCLSDTATGTVVEEGVAGHLLRSKFKNVLDGGVASGRAVLDSPLLF